MLRFKDFLRKGDFRVPICTTCRETIWPPFETCPICLSRTTFRRISKKGILREFSTTFTSETPQQFGIIDLGGVHVLGSVQGYDISLGCTVILYECGIDNNGHPFYNFRKCP